MPNAWMTTAWSKKFLNDALRILRRRKYTVLAVTLCAVFVTMLHVLATPPIFQASASFLLKFGREYVYRPEIGTSMPWVPPPRTNELVNAEIQILSSYDLKERVLERIGARRLYPDYFGQGDRSGQADPKGAGLGRIELAWREAVEAIRARVKDVKTWIKTMRARTFGQIRQVERTPEGRAAQTLSENLGIEAIKDAPVIRLSFTHQDPALASEVLRTLLEFFTEKRMGIYNEQQMAFLGQQVEENRNLLHQAERALQAFTERHGVFDFNRQLELLLGQEVQFDTQLKSDASRLTEIENRIAVIDSQLERTPRTVTLSSEVDTTQARAAEMQLLTLQQKLEELRVKYVDNSPQVQAVLKEMGQVRQFLRQQRRSNDAGRVTTGLNALYVQLQGERLALQSEQASLNAKVAVASSHLDTVRRELQDVATRQQTLRDLQREVEIRERNYNIARTKAEEERVAAALDAERHSNVRVIQQPLPPVRPLGMSWSVQAILSALLGALAGFGLAVLLEWRRGIFLSTESVEERLRIPVLLSIPDLRENRT